jgi:hypothetical protein
MLPATDGHSSALSTCSSVMTFCLELRWQKNKWSVNCKRRKNGTIELLLETLSSHLPGGHEKNHEIKPSLYSISQGPTVNTTTPNNEIHLSWLKSHWALSLLILQVSRSHSRRVTLGTTPLADWSASPRDPYLTTDNTGQRHWSMPPVGFESTMSASKQP